MAFPGIRGEPLTRFAIHSLLRKTVERASARCATLKKKRVSPRVVRHSTAMALLQSGIDIAALALWLGQESIETTNVYLHANLAMKEKALAKTSPRISCSITASAMYGKDQHSPRLADIRSRMLRNQMVHASMTKPDNIGLSDSGHPCPLAITATVFHDCYDLDASLSSVPYNLRSVVWDLLSISSR